MSSEVDKDFVDVELNNKDKHVTFTSDEVRVMMEEVSLRDKTNRTRRSKKSQGGFWDDTSESMNKIHDLWLFKIRKSSLIKATFWIALFVCFILFYFLDAFEAFRDEKTSFSFYKRSFSKKNQFESPTVIICTNPGFKASILEGCGYDELGDYIFMSDDINNVNNDCVGWDDTRYT